MSIVDKTEIWVIPPTRNLVSKYSVFVLPMGLITYALWFLIYDHKYVTGSAKTGHNCTSLNLQFKAFNTLGG